MRYAANRAHKPLRYRVGSVESTSPDGSVQTGTLGQAQIQHVGWDWGNSTFHALRYGLQSANVRRRKLAFSESCCEVRERSRHVRATRGNGTWPQWTSSKEVWHCGHPRDDGTHQKPEFEAARTNQLHEVFRCPVQSPFVLRGPTRRTALRPRRFLACSPRSPSLFNIRRRSNPVCTYNAR